MKEKLIEEVKKLNEEVKKIVNSSSESNLRIVYGDDFTTDSIKHNISQEKIDKALLNGLHLEDKHLYPSNPNKKHKGKNYYCICSHKTALIYVEYTLISYSKKPTHITLFHISPLSSGSTEHRRYKEILKNFSLKKT